MAGCQRVRGQLGRKPWWGPSKQKEAPSAVGRLLTCFGAGIRCERDFSQADGVFLARVNFIFLCFELCGLAVNSTGVCCHAQAGQAWVGRRRASPHRYRRCQLVGKWLHRFFSSLRARSAFRGTSQARRGSPLGCLMSSPGPPEVFMALSRTPTTSPEALLPPNQNVCQS